MSNEDKKEETNKNFDKELTKIYVSIIIILIYLGLIYYYFNRNTKHSVIHTVNNSKFWLNIIIGLSSFCIFITIFFFTYAARVEEEILTKQIENLIDDFTDNPIVDNIDKKEIRKILESIKYPDLKEDDRKVEENNKKLKIQGMVFCLVMLVMAVVCMVIYYKKSGDKDKGIYIKSILISNGVLLIFIGLTEFYYINAVIKQYYSLDPNDVKKEIIKTLKNYS
jgi:protein-S-isoprenylcysteine O-methyltransferase Ste14